MYIYLSCVLCRETDECLLNKGGYSHTWINTYIQVTTWVIGRQTTWHANWTLTSYTHPFTFIAKKISLECGVSVSGDHVVIDCRTNRLHLLFFWWWTKAHLYDLSAYYVQYESVHVHKTSSHPKVPCSYPIAITLGVSPPGSHSLRIIIEDDKIFTAEDTVSYFIERGPAPTGWGILHCI